MNRPLHSPVLQSAHAALLSCSRVCSTALWCACVPLQQQSAGSNAMAAHTESAAAEVLTMPDGTQLHVQLFKDVRNAPELREYLKSESKSRDMALINATSVAGKFHVQLAAFKALEAAANGKLTMRTVHAELVYCLAGSQNVGQSLKRCGLHDDTKHVLVAMFDALPQHVEDITTMVKGTQVPLEQLSDLSDPQVLQQVYKLTKEELQIGSIEDGVVARIAARDC